MNTHTTPGLFVRDDANPIITARDLPYQANTVFNAGAADLGDEVLLLVRVESCSGRSHLIVARSSDGVTDWRFDERALIHAADECPYETNGAEDARLTWLPERNEWVISYTGYTDQGPGVALATTRDFREIERLGLVMPPDNKNAVLFPRPIGGLHAMLHRPSGGGIWLSYSPDLLYWGGPSVVLPPRGGPWWDAVRVGATFAPIETEHGWLVIYHGVKVIAGGPIYRIGAALLDLEKPDRLIARARRWLLGPQMPYERSGDIPNVVFSCGGFVRSGELWLYYGAADSSICLARADLAEVIALVNAESTG